MSKRLLRLFLFLWVFLLGTAPAWADNSGTCGDGLTWALSGDGSNKTLTISYSGSGTGEMTDVAESSYGWHSERINIKTIVVGEGVTKITPNAFSRCSYLQSVSLPGTLVDIKYFAFASCINLTTISIPANVQYIGGGAFVSCWALKTIIVAEGNNYFTSVKPNGNDDYSILYDKDKTKLVFYPPQRPVENFVLPSTVTRIQARAFAYAGTGDGTQLKNILASENVQNIEQLAFEGSHIKKFIILSSTCSLEYTTAFSNVSDFKIYVPNSTVGTYKAATNWSTYSGNIEGFTYQLSNTVATLTLTPNVWPLGTENTSNVIDLASLEIKANAEVPIWSVESPAQIGGLTRKFTAATSVAKENYTMTPETTSSSEVGTGKTATATCIGDGTHPKDFSGSVTATYSITDAATATAPTANTLTYNGTAQALITAGSVTGGKMQYSKTGGDDYVDDATTITETNAGTYTVYWRVIPNDGYAYINKASQTVEVTINKKAPTAADFNFTAPADLVYNGSSKSATVVAKEGISGMGTVTVLYNESATAPTEAGEYTVKINVAAGSNYSAQSGLTDDTWKFKIFSGQATVTTAPTGATDLVYNRAAQCIVNTTSAACDGGTLVYSKTETGEYAAASTITETDAGTYSFWYKVQGNENHADSSPVQVTDISIAQKGITISGITAENKVYDGNTDATLVYPAITTEMGLVNGDELTITANGEYKGAFADKNVGEGKTVSFTVNSTNMTLGGAAAANYQLAASGHQASATANITQREVTIASGITAADKTYDGTTTATLTCPTITTTMGFVTNDNLTANATGAFVDENVGESKVVTISTITLTGTDASNYKLAASGQQASATAKITAKSITVTASNQEVVYNSGGYNLGTTAFTNTNDLVAGQNIAVTLEAVAAGSGEHQKKITPTVTIKSGETVVTGNYSITCVSGILTETVTVTPTTAWSTYYWNVADAYLTKVDGLTPYTVTGVTTSAVTTTSQDYIQGQTPYLLNGTASTTYTLTVNYNQSITGTPDGQFKYAATAVTCDAGTPYRYVLNGGEFIWQRGGTIPAGKCYIEPTNPSFTRSLGIEGGDGTTGIDSIENGELNIENNADVWYDMQGRRLSTKPTRKGVYVKNGNKVVIK